MILSVYRVTHKMQILNDTTLMLYEERKEGKGVGYIYITSLCRAARVFPFPHAKPPKESKPFSHPAPLSTPVKMFQQQSPRKSFRNTVHHRYNILDHFDFSQAVSAFAVSGGRSAEHSIVSARRVPASETCINRHSDDGANFKNNNHSYSYPLVVHETS